MLYLHQSNHLEQLASQFAALQRDEPLAPLATEQVVVQNSGMGRWLSLQTAGFNGIAANLRYLFPAEMTWELLRMVLAANEVPEKDPCAPAVMRWRLLAIFLQEPEEWPELARYLDGGATAAWQLAAQIAKVFDQYLFFRPDWIREWEQGKGASDDWQARLWWRVAGAQQLPHWVRLQERFAAALGYVDKDKLPQRICFFSVPVLSPGYVQLLGKVAEYIDIHIYLMNPCEEYWGDIESEKRKRKQQTDVQDYFSVGNPLLASWGRQGRDFLDLLIDANALDDDAQFYDLDEMTLLGRVQADMRYLRMPEEGLDGDSSIAFHACHSPMREAEVLYDQLLALFSAHPDVTPADVVVMTPDIDKYAPYLDAVFSSAPYPLPFSIADRSPGYVQSITNLCERLLEFPQGRCDVESVLALLEFEEVRARLGVDEAQVMQCRAWIGAVNIRWGTDARMRPELGGAGTHEHTWRYGLDRLLLGYAMPGEQLFGGILPWNEIEGSQAEILGRLQQVLDAVFELATWGQQQQTVSEWNRRFRYMLEIVVGEDAPLQSVWQALDNLEKTLAQAGFEQVLAWPVYQSALLELLDKRSESDGFLGRGITCCALMPMRTVPFRFVALIGMNDGVYPRRDARASFDRMGQAVKRGDRLKRDEDRYLFLESILSARDWLYVSYIGQSPHDNSELPPSVLVSELMDYLERCAPGSRKALLTKHPLQAFSRKYLRGENGVFTYNAYCLPTANASPALPDFSPPLTRGGWEGFLPPPDPAYRQVSLATLIRFYQHPARVFLQERFGLRLTEYAEELPIREPFGLEKYRDRELRACIFRQLQQALPASAAEPLLRAQGLLPHGKPGELVFRKEAGVTEDFFQSIQPLASLQHEPFKLAAGEFHFSGTLGNLDKAAGRKVYEFSKLSYWNWVDIWLHHLALNTLPDSVCPHQTLIYTPEDSFQLQAVADAAEQLQQLLDWYWQGLQEPLAFFPKSAFEACHKGGEFNMKSAMGTWSGEKYTSRECDKPEYRLLYRGVNPLEEQEETFVTIAQGVFGQMVNVRT